MQFILIECSSETTTTEVHLYLYNGAAVSLGVVDVERDVVFSLDAGTALVIYPDVLSLEA